MVEASHGALFPSSRKVIRWGRLTQEEYVVARVEKTVESKHHVELVKKILGHDEEAVE